MNDETQTTDTPPAIVPETDIAEKLEDRKTVTDEQAAARLAADEKIEAEKAAAAEEPKAEEPVAQPEIVHTPPMATEESAAQKQQSQTLNSPVGMQVKAASESMSRHDIPVRKLMPGTIVVIGSEKMTLLEAAFVTYPSAQNEHHFAALCQQTGNFEANRSQIKLRYGVDAVLLPLDDQFDYPDIEGMSEAEASAAVTKVRNAFIASLTEEEAGKFGISKALLEDYKAASTAS